jgi:hypothetical protein
MVRMSPGAIASRILRQVIGQHHALGGGVTGSSRAVEHPAQLAVRRHALEAVR